MSPTRGIHSLTKLGHRPWFQDPCCLGVDEAGRGPVLGPMVYACCFTPESNLEDLAGRKYADSKTLSEEKRELLFQGICDYDQVGYCVDVLSAQVLSAKMLARDKISLNAIALDSTFHIIQQVLDAGVHVTKVYVDTVGAPEAHAAKLSSRFPSLQFTVCPKADALYPIVSAASIVAKVIRDGLIRHYEAEQGEGGMKLGSGYPADPETKAWLTSHIDPVFGFPDFVRFSWETCTRLLEDQGVACSWEAEDDLGSNQAIICFGAETSSKGTSATNRHSYFRARRLQRLARF